jgi:nucleotide-binding universal stress UspA family protein
MMTLKHILVATDFGEASGAALMYGRAFARTCGASLHVLHVVDNRFMKPGASDPHEIKSLKVNQLNACLSDNDRGILHACAIVVTSNTPAQAIVDYAKSANIGLIVMGTHGRGAVAQLLVGSVAERVVRTAPCPVLTVRPPEPEFVVPVHERIASLSGERSALG